MKAIIKIDVPDFQIGQEVNIHFKDSMVAKGVVALLQEPCDDAISRQAAIDAIENEQKKIMRSDWAIDQAKFSAMSEIRALIADLPSVITKNPNTSEIEQKCDRINSLASVLPYAPHREIQELLCEIMDLCKAESDGEE